VEGNTSVGVALLEDSFTEVLHCVVRGTLPDGRGLGGWGVAGETADFPGLVELWLRASLVEDNREFGLFASGLRLVSFGNMVRGTQPNDAGELGHGIHVQPKANARGSASLSLGNSVIEDNHEVGVFVSGRSAFIDTTVVRGTKPSPTGEGGRGIEIHTDSDLPAEFDLFASLVEQNHEAAVIIGGAEAVIRENVIRGTRPGVEGNFGRGVHVQGDLSGAVHSLSLQSTLIEGSHGIGLTVLDAAAQVEKSIVRDSAVDAAGQFGDGVLVVSINAPADAVVTQSRIEASARAAIAMFGAHVAMGESQLLCQAFDLAAEPWNEVQSVFEDLGENWCGCPVAQVACKAVGGVLEPP
jgi:hypothetical protein